MSMSDDTVDPALSRNPTRRPRRSSIRSTEDLDTHRSGTSTGSRLSVLSAVYGSIGCVAR